MADTNGSASPMRDSIKHFLYAGAGGAIGTLAGFGVGLVVAVVGAAAGITPLIGLTPSTLLAVETVIGLGMGTLGGAVMSWME